MTEEEKLELREKINKYKLNGDLDICADKIRELLECIEDINGYKFLCRYRKLNKYELQSLQNDTIFMRWPSTYEDHNDCRLVFDSQEIAEYIQLKNCLNYNIDELKKHIEENAEYKEITENLRNMCLVSCFTERFNNERMWEQYACNSTGICMLYEVHEILYFLKNCNGKVIFLPVQYIDDRENYQDIMLNHHDLLEDRDDTRGKLLLTYMTKEKEEYSFEEEWRLLYEKNGEKSETIGEVIPFIKPRFILCGEKLDQTSDEYNELVQIAKDKEIELICLHDMPVD